ncbi:TPA: hypothetical protein SMW12_001569 [Pseudomonas aeruginosa]|nr:hypothetical protein [Pseudomonas aeruginosa]HEK2915805.1 hypothetical protein [Pseudomonas aeruginosa]HEK3359633.1 hypothetical protein [Pseudomonas aeruginosa]
MNRNEILHGKAELNFLEKLSKRPGISKISARSLESRMKRTQDRISATSENTPKPAKVILTYRGKPVWGTLGVQADFGMTATAAFNEAVATVAASLTGTLNNMGPIPNRSSNQLLITGTAIGSFGFELQEAPSESLQLQIEGMSPVAEALELIAELLEASTKSDEELSEPVSKLQGRALVAVSEFLDKLTSNDAACSITTRYRSFRFSDSNQVLISKSRLSTDNIKELDYSLTGIFLGVFPDKRTFEFKTSDDKVIHGTISREIENPAAINRNLEKNVVIKVHTRQVGSGKPRYQLREMPLF